MATAQTRFGAHVRWQVSGGIAPEMWRATSDLVKRWNKLPDGSVVVVNTEMLRLAMDVQLRCIFSDGVGDAEAVRDATTRFYSTCGTLDPLDVIGVPDFVPRLTRLRERPIMQNFDRGLNLAIAETATL